MLIGQTFSKGRWYWMWLWKPRLPHQQNFGARWIIRECLGNVSIADTRFVAESCNKTWNKVRKKKEICERIWVTKG